jgi:hypothetical protein
MSQDEWGVPLPPPRTESRFFNAARRTVSLLVEAGIDARFWRIHCARDCHVRHHDQGGRDAVLRALDQARGDPEAVLLAVLDADLDRLEGRLEDRDDVIWTDAHDLETTLFTTPALEKLANFHLDPDKLQAAEQRWRETFRVRLFRHAAGFGRLRWLKSRSRDELDLLVFKKTSKRQLSYFDRYSECAAADWTPDLKIAIRKIIDYSSAHSLLERDLAAECEALPAADLHQLCNGHDLLGLLAAGLAALGSGNKPKADALAEALATACERAWLLTTAMWRAIESWERAHPGYPVLRQDPD